MSSSLAQVCLVCYLTIDIVIFCLCYTLLGAFKLSDKQFQRWPRIAGLSRLASKERVTDSRRTDVSPESSCVR